MKKIFVTAGATVALLVSALTVAAQSTSRETVLREIETKRNELSALEKLYLAPSEEDQAMYAEFLKQPQTGLMRLLPRDKFDAQMYKEAKPTLTIRGAGSYYSFTKRTHDYNSAVDIMLERDNLVSGFHGGQFGIITKVDEVQLERVSLETPAVQNLIANGPSRHTRQSQTPLKLDSTYLIRSVNQSQSDALVAFRVVRVDTDGSAIILWKLLKDFSASQVAEKN